MDDKTITRFWSKVDKNGPVPSHMPHLGHCWIWIASRMSTGYGAFNYPNGNSPTQLSHRVAWQLSNGPIPNRLFVLHRCDNRKCVNPEHLFLGTNTDNVRDMIAKNRSPNLVKNLGPVRRGSSQPNSKLIESQIIEIRRLGTDGFSCQKIAEQFGVTHGAIRLIIKRERWSHI